ncbi:hypothetical protein ABIB40_003808 [Pedobacter sp. UYP30]|uniref:hypothetical protein n=1 Tax=Pedobacter sp. UYP30 TaxID=1756400 RepID=UPI003392C985
MKSIALSLFIAFTSLTVCAKSLTDSTVKHNKKLFPVTTRSSIYSNGKFAYAELVYQNRAIASKIWVTGKYVSQDLINAVGTGSSASQALDLMGDDGWELVTAVTRNFDNGFEIYYYFKKDLK